MAPSTGPPRDTPRERARGDRRPTDARSTGRLGSTQQFSLSPPPRADRRRGRAAVRRGAHNRRTTVRVYPTVPGRFGLRTRLRFLYCSGPRGGRSGSAIRRWRRAAAAAARAWTWRFPVPGFELRYRRSRPRQIRIPLSGVNTSLRQAGNALGSAVPRGPLLK